MVTQLAAHLRTFHPIRLVLFVVLSLGDLYLTYQLLNHSDEFVYETNPVANWWLSSYGWAGLASYKLAMIALVAGLAIVISLYRPRAGSMLLTFACSAVAVVVVYSFGISKVISGDVNVNWLLGDPEPVLAEGSHFDLEEHLAQLVEDLEDEDGITRQSAAWRLGRLGQDAAQAVPTLVSNLLRLPDEETHAEQRALVMIGSAAVPTLEELLLSDCPYAQQKAAELLARIEAWENRDMERFGAFDPVQHDSLQ